MKKNRRFSKISQNRILTETHFIIKNEGTKKLSKPQLSCRTYKMTAPKCMKR